MDNKPDKMERIAARLQRKIAEQAAQYELQIVLLEDELEELKAANGTVQSEA